MYMYKKNDFTEGSKNLVRYRSKNNIFYLDQFKIIM